MCANTERNFLQCVNEGNHTAKTITNRKTKAAFLQKYCYYETTVLLPTTCTFYANSNCRAQSCITTHNLIIFLMLAVFSLIPLVSSSTYSQSALVTSIPTTYAHDNKSSSLDSIFNDELQISTTSSPDDELPLPRVQGVRKGKKRRRRKKARCPKKFRKSYCMNKGKCRWSKDLKTPTCRCKKGWVGERCDETYIDFSLETNEDNKNIIITVAVLSGFGFIGFITMFCICWRRFKHVRSELKSKEDEKITEVMLTAKNSNNSFVHISDSS